MVFTSDLSELKIRLRFAGAALKTRTNHTKIASFFILDLHTYVAKAAKVAQFRLSNLSLPWHFPRTLTSNFSHLLSSLKGIIMLMLSTTVNALTIQVAQ